MDIEKVNRRWKPSPFVMSIIKKVRFRLTNECNLSAALFVVVVTRTKATDPTCRR